MTRSTLCRCLAFAGVGALMVLLALASPVFAHAFPDHASPAVGAIVAQAPAEVQIWFSEKLEPAFSRIEVLDAKGQRVDAGPSRLDAQDSSLLLVALKPLSPGVYKVVWHVVSADTHATEGDFTFTVGGG
jgi:copper resistance protein C